MKQTFRLGMLALALSALNVQAQDSKSEKEIEKAITLFVETADAQDADKMAEILDPNFMSITNRLFGSESTSVSNRDTYIALLKDKKIGGDKRKVEVLSIDINGDNASAKAIYDGNILKFTSYVLLAKDVKGTWRVVSDYPTIEKK